MLRYWSFKVRKSGEKLDGFLTIQKHNKEGKPWYQDFHEICTAVGIIRHSKMLELWKFALRGKKSCRFQKRNFRHHPTSSFCVITQNNYKFCLLWEKEVYLDVQSLWYTRYQVVVRTFSFSTPSDVTVLSYYPKQTKNSTFHGKKGCT